MRINCDIQINNRNLSSLNASTSNQKASRSVLGIGKQSSSKDDGSNFFLHICNAKNKTGNKYKVDLYIYIYSFSCKQYY